MEPQELRPILQEAKEKGFLKPTNETNICFVKYLNTANRLLWMLAAAEGSGLSTSQVIHRIDLSRNTCICYLREFVRIGLADRKDKGQQDTIWFYSVVQLTETATTIKVFKRKQ